MQHAARYAWAWSSRISTGPHKVRAAVRRLRAGVLDRLELRDRITLTVVDNSRNLDAAEMPGARVLPNRNLGGTGGFVRGLPDLMDGSRHTHALFMDDDAACEPEAVARCFALLQHARDDRQAVAGALLHERTPWLLFEKGARFDGQVRPLSSGLDMRRVEDLLQAERPLVQPDYGAWWFFAFALAHAVLRRAVGLRARVCRRRPTRARCAAAMRTSMSR